MLRTERRGAAAGPSCDNNEDEEDSRLHPSLCRNRNGRGIVHLLLVTLCASWCETLAILCTRFRTTVSSPCRPVPAVPRVFRAEPQSLSSMPSDPVTSCDHACARPGVKVQSSPATQRAIPVSAADANARRGHQQHSAACRHASATPTQPPLPPLCAPCASIHLHAGASRHYLRKALPGWLALLLRDRPPRLYGNQ